MLARVVLSSRRAALLRTNAAWRAQQLLSTLPVFSVQSCGPASRETTILTPEAVGGLQYITFLELLSGNATLGSTRHVLARYGAPSPAALSAARQAPLQLQIQPCLSRVSIVTRARIKTCQVQRPAKSVGSAPSARLEACSPSHAMLAHMAHAQASSHSRSALMYWQDSGRQPIAAHQSNVCPIL